MTVHELREQLSEYAIEYAGAREELYYVEAISHPDVKHEDGDLDAFCFAAQRLVGKITTERKFWQVKKATERKIAEISKERKGTYGKLAIFVTPYNEDLEFIICIGGELVGKIHAHHDLGAFL
nr:hypothetical protein [uncultured Prevotella sp.]